MTVIIHHKGGYWNCAILKKNVLAFDFCRLSVVIRVFHPRHNCQWPPTSKDFYTRSYPLHYFLILFLELCNKDYQDFGKFNSLKNTLTDSRSNMSLSSCLLLTLMKQHLDMCTYKVGTQQRRRWLATFDIAIHNRFKDHRLVSSCFNSVYSPILF